MWYFLPSSKLKAILTISNLIANFFYFDQEILKFIPEPPIFFNVQKK